MIKINYLEIEGFRSIKNMSFPFQEKNMIILQGRNGAGKSTIFEAVFFAFYGSGVKQGLMSELSTLPRYRDHDFKGTRVGLTFSIGDDVYVIYRTIDYGTDKVSGVQILKNSELLPVESKAHGDSLIKDIIGIDKELFMQSVFFAQKSLRLVDKKDADRRDVLDQLFSLDFSEYEAKAKHKVVELKDQVAATEKEVSTIQSEINRLATDITNTRSFIANFEGQKNEKLLALDESIDAKQQALVNLGLQDIAQVMAPDPIDDQEKLRLEQELLACNTAVTKWQTMLNIPEIQDTCNVCGSMLKPKIVAELQQKRTEQLEDIKKNLFVAQANLEAKQQEVDAVNKKFAEYNEKYRSYMETYMQNQNILKSQENLQNMIDFELKRRSELVNEVCSYTEEFVQTLETQKMKATQLLVEKEKCLYALVKDTERYSYWATQGFTDKGLKAYILNAKLMQLNQALRKYGELLGIHVSIDIKMQAKLKSFDVKIQGIDGVEKSYSSLSGGEQKRVDIIVSFALHDVVPAKFSFMVLDEIFEGLDEEGLNTALLLIREKAEHQAVYIVTFNINIDISQALFIDVKKVNNFTVVS